MSHRYPGRAPGRVHRCRPHCRFVCAATLLATLGGGIGGARAVPPGTATMPGAAKTPTASVEADVARATSFPPPPRIATTVAELAAIEAAPDFATVKAAALRAGDALLAAPVPLPEGPAGWIFYYACPDDGSSLQPIDLNHHQCPLCKKIYSDERTVAAYRYRLHTAAEAATITLGWAYTYSGDDRYAAAAKRIFLKLAHDYPTYPERLDRWGHSGADAPLGGRAFAQSLDEAYSIIRLAKGYDLTRTAPTWTVADHQLVEHDLFGLTAQTLLAFNQDVNNHQTWYDAGLLAIASVLGDSALAHQTLTMRGGINDQLQRSVGDDGLWYEGTMAYHFYALQAMIEAADIARRMGMPITANPRFKSLFEGPLRAAYPDGRYPAINDSDPMGFQQESSFYDWAFKTYGDPRFAQAAASGNPARLSSLLGAAAVPQWPLDTHSEVLSGAGLAVLRQGSGPSAVCTFLDYGQHGGGHGHFDKLNLMLYANGREWLLDAGRLDYSHKEYLTWVKHTAAHNTVTVDGRSQLPNTGKLLFFDQGANYSACAARSDGSYFDTRLQRTLVLTDSMLVDIYDVTTPAATQIDWFAHAVSSDLQPVEARGPGTAQAPGDENGYQHLTGGTRYSVQGTARWDFLADAKDPAAPRLRLWLVNQGSRSAPAEDEFTCTGIGYTLAQKVPCLIRRRTAAATRFITLYDLSGQGDYIQSVSATNTDTLRVVTRSGTWTVTVDDRGVQCKLSKLLLRH